MDIKSYYEEISESLLNLNETVCCFSLSYRGTF